MIRINLLKAEAKAPILEQIKVKEKKLTFSPSLILGLVIIILAALAFFQINSINKEKTLLTLATEEKVKLGDVEAKLNKVELQRNIILKKINLIGELKSFQEVAVRILDEISKTIPDWVWLDEVSYDKKQIRIKGKAISNKLIADYISNLEESPIFAGVELISSIQQARANERFLEFLLTTNYIFPVPAKPANPPPKENQGR